MDYAFVMQVIPFVLVLGLVIFFEIGRYFGIRSLEKDGHAGRQGTSVIEGAIFALIGLLLSLSFSGSVSRFHEQRQLIVNEANAIGTAYLRLDLLPSDRQAPLREGFRRYVESRLEVYRLLPDLQASREKNAEANLIQREIWTQAVAACSSQGAQPYAAMLLLPALNQMIDTATYRTRSGAMHPPAILMVLLVLMTFDGALIAGYATSSAKHRSLLHMLGYVAITAVTLYFIIDIEYPRFGLIRVDAFDRSMLELRESMK
jgi:hypothetical protein